VLASTLDLTRTLRIDVVEADTGATLLSGDFSYLAVTHFAFESTGASLVRIADIGLMILVATLAQALRLGPNQLTIQTVAILPRYEQAIFDARWNHFFAIGLILVVGEQSAMVIIADNAFILGISVDVIHVC